MGNSGDVSCESPEDGGEVCSSVGGESASDVFPDNPRGSEFISDAALLGEQSTAVSVQSSTKSSNGKVLAGASSHDEFGNRDSICGESFTGHLSYVVVDGQVGVVVAQHGACLGVDFAAEDQFVAGAHESEVAAAAT